MSEEREWKGDESESGEQEVLFYLTPRLQTGERAEIPLRAAAVQQLLPLEVDDAGDAVEGATPLPEIAELRAGWNFLQDTRNTFGGIGGAGWLLRQWPAWLG
jgi:chitinase